MIGNLEIGKCWPSLGHTCVGSICQSLYIKMSAARNFQELNQFFDLIAWIGGPNDGKLKLTSARPTTMGQCLKKVKVNPSNVF